MADYGYLVNRAEDLADEARQAEIARENAMLRLRRNIRPVGGPSRTPSRSEISPSTEQSILDFLIPQTPLDIGLTVAAGPVGRTGARLGAAALGAMLDPDPAEAGAIGAARRLLFPPRTQMGDFPSTTARRIIGKTKGEDRGYSVHIPTGEMPGPGSLMVGQYRNQDPRTMVLQGGNITPTDVLAHFERNRKQLEQGNKFFGTWRSSPDETIYLDVSRRFDPEEIRQATKFGERTGQLAGYRVGTGEFPIGNWEQYVRDNDYVTRLNEMAKVGREYLEGHPTPEWWNMYGTAFERVYGPALPSMRPVAGFTAATAPNTAPRQNLQMMSEYMRRQLAGEPTIQPGWRVPAGTMSRQEGSRIGMEGSRIANLERAAGGDLEALRREKVNREARAMIGDPDVAVIDRHQIRLTEVPEKGIFAGTQEGALPSGAAGSRAYNLVEGTMRAAKPADRTLRDWSADVWAGIRETIKNTNQLFGTPYRGAAVSGESKSYADHFEDLLGAVSKHYRISQAELEKRLRAGDMSLLTGVIATPAITRFLRQSGVEVPGGLPADDEL